jgi:hypothetical protein
MQTANQEYEEIFSNLFLSHPTKVTHVREELKTKNNGGGEPMTPRSRFEGFPSLREGIDLSRL